MSPLDLLWLFFILSSLQPMLEQRLLAMRRTQVLRALEKRNGSRAITLIHRREHLSFLGIPFGGYIDIDDSEALIRAIEMSAPTIPIDLVLHTPGGLVLAAEQIATAVTNHPGPVTIHVPHYAMSGGTLIALGADQIVMAPSAVLGPVDPNWASTRPPRSWPPWARKTPTRPTTRPSSWPTWPARPRPRCATSSPTCCAASSATSAPPRSPSP
jgi:ClpP class serine protease